MALIPGTKASKVIELFESKFGKARPQTISCDASIQTEDVSEEVDQDDAHGFRAVIGCHTVAFGKRLPRPSFCCERIQQLNEPSNSDCNFTTSKGNWIPENNG